MEKYYLFETLLSLILTTRGDVERVRQRGEQIVVNSFF